MVDNIVSSYILYLKNIKIIRAVPTALYLALCLEMWRAKMQKWCSNRLFIYSSYCQITTVTFHKWKATVTLHLIKKLYPTLSFHDRLSLPPFLFSFSFLQPSLLSPLLKLSAWCGVPISTWGGPIFVPISAWVERRSRPGWNADLGLVWNVNLSLQWSSISAWYGVPISAWGGAWSRPGWSLDLGLGGVQISAWGWSSISASCGVLISAWGEARSRPRWSAEVGLGFCGNYFCDFLCGNCGVGFVCGVIYCVDLGLYGFDMVAEVWVVVVIVWDGGCCDGECVGDGCEKK